MSLYLLNRSFKKKATFSNEKPFKKSHAILLKYLTEKGGDEKNGVISNIFPSVPTMAEHTLLGESTIYECLRDFKEDGMLIKVGTTKFRTVNYIMIVSKVERVLTPMSVHKENNKYEKNESQLAYPSRNWTDIPPETGPNPLDNPLYISTKVKDEEEGPELNQLDQIEELYMLSNKLADMDHIRNCIHKFGMNVEQMMTAIAACNALNLSANNYNKYFKVATHQAKEGTTEERIKYIVQERIKSSSNKQTPKPRNNGEMARIEISSDDIVVLGLNYNRNFGQPYVINSKYEYARAALTAAGVSFEIR